MITEIVASATETTLALKGDLDTGAALDLDLQLEALVPTLDGNLVIDLSELVYLNSTGIRSFIRLDKALKPLGKSFVFREAAARIVRIFQYCGLDTYFTFEAGPALVKR